MNKKKSISMIEDKRTRILAVAIWVVVGFFVFRGIISIFTYQDANEIKKEMDSYRTQTSLKSDNGTAAGAFAESYVTDYFDCDTENEEGYIKKMASYYSEGVSFEQPEQDSQTEFVSVKNISVNGDKVDVDIKARISYTITHNTDGRISVSKPIKTVVLRVPVGIKDGNFAVTSLPFYVASSNSVSKVPCLETVSDNAEDEDKKQIEILTENFLKAYYGSSAGELKYYVTDDYGNISVVGNGVQLEEIEEQRTEEKGDVWITDVFYTINDSGAYQKQHIRLEIVKKGKYYVNKVMAQ